MFFRGINEFESKFKLFDRLNSLLFNVWRGKAAETARAKGSGNRILKRTSHVTLAVKERETKEVNA